MVKKVLILGATGYVGTRLVDYLMDYNYEIRVGYRSLDKIKEKSWFGAEGLEYIKVDVFDLQSLKLACRDINYVYYLVHSMNPSISDYSNRDKIAAENMLKATESENIELIIYLGGLGDNNPRLSKHLRSRAEVGNILQSGKVPTTVLRAAIIIGSGSASFEILRYLMEHLPIMTTPKWVNTKNQPIAIHNVLIYLVKILENKETWGKSLDIGGNETLTYKQLMEIYAQEAQLWKRLIIPIPILSPKLSSYWVDLITPVNKDIARPLVEGLKNEVVMQNFEIRQIIPQELISVKDAISRSLKESKLKIYHWEIKRNKISIRPEFSAPGDPHWSGGHFLYDRRVIKFSGDQAKVWKQIDIIGGKNGWYYGNILWNIRGALDQIIGGVGMKRGRENNETLIIGNFIDCWRIQKLQKYKMVLLSAEMRLPGYASLKFEIHPTKVKDQFILEQFAAFVPRGLGGLVYWYIVLPLHMSVFSGMLKGLLKSANVNILTNPILLNKEKVISG
jgi:uncharacterized protein YbjT (DUF2867 family)